MIVALPENERKEALYKIEEEHTQRETLKLEQERERTNQRNAQGVCTALYASLRNVC